jgi:hypothetical protein
MRGKTTTTKSIPKPTSDDISKLNSEVNQYLNQQFNLLIGTVTIMGFVVSWVSQKISVGDANTMNFAYLGCMALLLFLCLMVVVEARLQIAIEILANYLRLSDISVWENQHEAFVQLSQRKYGFRFTSRHLFLGTSVALASAWPFVLSSVVFGRVIYLNTIYFFMGAIVIAFTFVFALMPYVVGLRRRHVIRTWQEVLGHLSPDV